MPRAGILKFRYSKAMCAIKSAFGLHRHEVESMCAKLGYERGIQGIILIFENDLMPFDGIFAQF